MPNLATPDRPKPHRAFLLAVPCHAPPCLAAPSRAQPRLAVQTKKPVPCYALSVEDSWHVSPVTQAHHAQSKARYGLLLASCPCQRTVVGRHPATLTILLYYATSIDAKTAQSSSPHARRAHVYSLTQVFTSVSYSPIR